GNSTVSRASSTCRSVCTNCSRGRVVLLDKSFTAGVHVGASDERHFVVVTFAAVSGDGRARTSDSNRAVMENTVRSLLRALVVLAALLVLPRAAFAQATIAGVVRDSSGGVVPGVTVEASSPALTEKVRTVT